MDSSTGTSLDDFSDVVPGGINANSSSVDSMGLPASNPVSQNPTNLVTTSPDQTSNGGIIDSLEGYFGNAVDSVENGASSLVSGASSVASSAASGVSNAASSVLHGAEAAVTGAYGAVKTVATDVTSGVSSIGSGIFNHFLLYMIVAGGILYLVMSTNNVKVNASVPIA